MFVLNNTFEHIENKISETPLYSLLGADGIDDLRHKVIDIICEQIQDDLKENCYYLIDPDDVNETLGKNIIQEAVDEIKDEWKDRLKGYMSKKLEDMLK